MGQFYMAIIFLGISLMLFSLGWVVLDKRRSLDYESRMDKKKEELIGIIQDAEGMIEELNKFSDYIVSQMEFKGEELSQSLKNFDEKIVERKMMMDKTLDEHKVRHDLILEQLKKGRVDQGHIEKKQLLGGQKFEHYPSELPVMMNFNDPIRVEPTPIINHSIMYGQGKALQKKVREKIISLSNKHRDVLNLAGMGLSNTEIAKRLSMGKGEIQLILDLNK